MSGDTIMTLDTERIATKTILIVEDDDSIGKFLVMALSLETPYVVMHVSDGFQALKVLNSIKPDLLITDYHLPRMDGLELYDLLQERRSTDHIPVIVMSAYLPEQEVEKRNLIGLNKPFELDELIDTVKRLLA
jgi:CheY-like chemotaxis protein